MNGSERRWDIHMKSELVFKLRENNLNKGLEVMRMFWQRQISFQNL